MKRVLITGGCGFLGAHLIEHIVENTDWEIVILDRLSYASNMHSVTGVELLEEVTDSKKEYLSRISFIWHDLAASMDHLKLPDFDYVVHLAAETHVDRSTEDSRQFVCSNVLGTANLLEYLRRKQSNIKKIINFSTDEVYGAADVGVAYKEFDCLRPSNPYSAAKAGQDMIAYSFAHAYQMPILTTRCMNMFGERQNHEKFIPKTLRSIISGEKVILHGSPNLSSSRFWIHARNVSDAVIYLLTHDTEINDMFHIAGIEFTVYEIAMKIQEILNIKFDIEWVDFQTARPGCDARYALDGSKLERFGWKQPISFEDSFIKTIKWMYSFDHRKWLL
jgi:dTDP-glucose 4,6-dehydratase